MTIGDLHPRRQVHPALPELQVGDVEVPVDLGGRGGARYSQAPAHVAALGRLGQPDRQAVGPVLQGVLEQVQLERPPAVGGDDDRRRAVEPEVQRHLVDREGGELRHGGLALQLAGLGLQPEPEVERAAALRLDGHGRRVDPELGGRARAVEGHDERVDRAPEPEALGEERSEAVEVQTGDRQVEVEVAARVPDTARDQLARVQIERARGGLHAAPRRGQAHAAAADPLAVPLDAEAVDVEPQGRQVAPRDAPVRDDGPVVPLGGPQLVQRGRVRARGLHDDLLEGQRPQRHLPGRERDVPRHRGRSPVSAEGDLQGPVAVDPVEQQPSHGHDGARDRRVRVQDEGGAGGLPRAVLPTRQPDRAVLERELQRAADAREVGHVRLRIQGEGAGVDVDGPGGREVYAVGAGGEVVDRDRRTLDGGAQGRRFHMERAVYEPLQIRGRLALQRRRPRALALPGEAARQLRGQGVDGDDAPEREVLGGDVDHVADRRASSEPDARVVDPEATSALDLEVPGHVQVRERPGHRQGPRHDPRQRDLLREGLQVGEVQALDGHVEIGGAATDPGPRPRQHDPVVAPVHGERVQRQVRLLQGPRPVRRDRPRVDGAEEVGLDLGEGEVLVEVPHGPPALDGQLNDPHHGLPVAQDDLHVAPLDRDLAHVEGDRELDGALALLLRLRPRLDERLLEVDRPILSDAHEHDGLDQLQAADVDPAREQIERVPRQLEGVGPHRQDAPLVVDLQPLQAQVAPQGPGRRLVSDLAGQDLVVDDRDRGLEDPGREPLAVQQAAHDHEEHERERQRADDDGREQATPESATRSTSGHQNDSPMPKWKLKTGGSSHSSFQYRDLRKTGSVQSWG